MNTRIAQFASRAMEAGWLAAVIVTPLFFNVWSSRVFEPDKLTLLRSIALFMVTAGLIRRLELGMPSVDGLRNWLKTPLVGPVLLLTTMLLISTLTSLVPWISLTGSYNRLQGLYTWTAYVMVFLSIVTLLRTRVQLDRMVDAMLLPSLPIALYGVVQRFGVDPMPWIGDVTVRVASTLGNSIFVAAYLIMAVPLTIVRLVAAFRNLDEDETNAGVLRVASYLVLLIVQIVAIVLSQSRGPQLGFLASTGFLVLLLAALRPGRQMMFSVLGVGAVLAALLVAVNLPNTPLAGFKDIPYVGRLGRIFETDEGTGKVRTLIWSGAVDLISKGPQDRHEPWRYLVGFGPESMQVAYNPYYPPALGNLESRNASPDRSHNETFDWLINTGFLGFAAYLLLFTSVFYYALRWLGLIATSGQRNLFLLLWIGGAVITVLAFRAAMGTMQFFGVALPAGAVTGLFAYLAVRTLAGWHIAERPGSLILAGVVAALIGHFVEIHFGIAIASTRVLFFALIGLMVVMGGLTGNEPSEFAETEPDAPSGSAPAGMGKARRRAAAVPRRTGASPAGVFWKANTFLVLVAFVTMTYSFLVKTNTSDPKFGTDMLVILWLLSLTWVIGSLMLGTELIGRVKAALAGHAPRPGDSSAWRGGMPWYAAITIFTPLVYGAIHFFVLQGGQQSGQGADTFSALLLFYYTILFSTLLGWAFLASRDDPEPAVFSRGISVAAYPVLAIVFLAAVLFSNVNEVRADVYYKEAYSGWHSAATQSDNAGKREDAAEYYKRAVEAYQKARGFDGAEDYYLLFLGKALLERADSRAQELLNDFANAGLAEGQSEYADPALAGKVKERDQLFDTAFETLLQAYDTSPLNTDHSANLARAYQVWGERTLDPQKRALHLDQSRKWFKTAMDLSKHNAGLREEAAVTEYLDGKTDGALALVTEAERIDPQYQRPLRLKANILRDQEKWAEAEAVYRQYVDGSGASDVQALSGLAFVLGRQNKLADAKEINLRVLARVPGDLSTLRNLAIITRDLNQKAEGCSYIAKGLEVSAEDEGLQQLELELGCAQITGTQTTPGASLIDPANPVKPSVAVESAQPPAPGEPVDVAKLLGAYQPIVTAANMAKPAQPQPQPQAP